MDDKGLELKKMLAMLDPERLTQEDFTLAFEEILKFLEEHTTTVSGTIEQARVAMEEASTSTSEDNQAKFDALANELVTTLSGSLQEGEKRSNEALERLEARLAAIKDGQDADPEQVTQEVLRRIVIPTAEDVMNGLPALGERTRDGLELLPEGQKLVIDAVEGLRKELDELKEGLSARPAGKVGGGGTSAIGVASALGFAGRTETPSGAVNGSNVTYTTIKPINFIFSFMINGENIPSSAYTIAGKTITFGTALSADYAASDFEIKYV